MQGHEKGEDSSVNMQDEVDRPAASLVVVPMKS